MHEGSTARAQAVRRTFTVTPTIPTRGVCTGNVRSTPLEILRTVYIQCVLDLTSDNNAPLKIWIQIHEILRQLSRVHEQCQYCDGMQGYQYEVDLQSSVFD